MIPKPNQDEHKLGPDAVSDEKSHSSGQSSQQQGQRLDAEDLQIVQSNQSHAQPQKSSTSCHLSPQSPTTTSLSARRTSSKSNSRQ
jgi:hypothetical protein